MKRALLIIALLLFFVPNAIADYQSYVTYSDNNGLWREISGDIGKNNYTQIIPNIPNTGSFTEALTYDFDTDGITEIILSGNNNSIILVEGDKLDFNSDVLYVGNPEITGVICDFQNTGKTKQYVTIAQNSSGERNILVINVSNGEMNIVAQKRTNQTNLYGNIICTDFYRYENGGVDKKNYIFWLDTEKYFHEAYFSTGGNIVEAISDIEDSVYEEDSGTYTFNGGSHTIALSDGFKKNKRTLAYTAGDTIVGITSDGHTFYENWKNDVGLSGTFQSQSRLHIFGDVDAGNGEKGFLIVPATSLPNGGNYYAIALYYEKGYTNDFSLANRLAHPNPAGITMSFEIAPAIHDYNNNEKDDLYYILTTGLGNSAVLVYPINNLSDNTPVIGLQSGYSMPTNGYPPRIYVMTNGDIIVPSSSLGGVFLSRPLSGNYTDATARVIGYMPSGTLNTNNFYSPQPIQIGSDDSYIDFLYTSPIATRFYLSAGEESVLQTTRGFSVALNTTTPYSAITKIIAKFNDTDNSFRYAVTCDIGTDTVWNEEFTTAYNFSNRNVSVSSLLPAELFLTYSGLTIPTNDSYVSIIKDSPIPVRAISKHSFTYLVNQKNTVMYNAYAGDTQRTFSMEINDTGSTVFVNEISQFFERIPIGNFTKSGNVTQIEVLYIPEVDIYTGKNYFTAKIFYRNQTVGTTTTAAFGGEDIDNVELFTDTPNITVTIKNIGFFLAQDLNPEFRTFQNAGLEHADGTEFVFYSGTTTPEVSGNGFLIIAGMPDSYATEVSFGLSSLIFGTPAEQVLDIMISSIGFGALALPITFYEQAIGNTDDIDEQAEIIMSVVIDNVGGNNVFFSKCDYDQEGTYIQRHFMSEPRGEIDDWSNYKDISVTITKTGEAPPTGEQGTIDNPPAGENVITSFFQDVGVTDQATAFVAWIFLSVVVAGFAFALHPAFGILTFVALMMLGVYIGMMPLWVIILFVIIAGGIFVTVYRNITSGT